MAVRPSHWSHGDQSSYITLKWHRPSPSWTTLAGTGRVLWAAVTSSHPPICPPAWLDCPSAVSKNSRASNCAAEIYAKQNFLRPQFKCSFIILQFKFLETAAQLTKGCVLFSLLACFLYKPMYMFMTALSAFSLSSLNQFSVAAIALSDIHKQSSEP